MERKFGKVHQFGSRIVRNNFKYEFGFRIGVSRQTFSVRIQLGALETITYWKYGLYLHEIEGTPAWHRLNVLRKESKDGHS